MSIIQFPFKCCYILIQFSAFSTKDVTMILMGIVNRLHISRCYSTSFLSYSIQPQYIAQCRAMFHANL